MDFSTVIRDRIISSSPVGGGDIGRSFRVETSGGEYFVKHYPGSGTSAAEAAGLEAIAATGTVSVPEVVGFDEHFIVLRYITQAPRCPDFQMLLGRGLARMHRVSAAEKRSGEEYFGFYRNNFIGSTVQINEWRNNWIEFFTENRIGLQVRLTADEELSGCWDSLRRRIPELLSATVEAPSLLHGDLWGGNVISGPDGRPVLIDPAVYYGHREMDLGMTMLFGGFSSDFYTAYDEEYPLKNGWRNRMNLYKLYHVLNHMNMFGGGYRGQALSLMKSYL